MKCYSWCLVVMEPNLVLYMYRAISGMSDYASMVFMLSSCPCKTNYNEKKMMN